jgi:hypothetical protein
MQCNGISCSSFLNALVPSQWSILVHGQVPFKLFGCTIQGGPSLLWDQVTAELNHDFKEQLMDLDIERKML